MDLPRMYRDLAEWWPLLSPHDEYADDAERVYELLARFGSGPVGTMLELGSGGGHTAHHLAKRYAMTLVDLSEDMMDVSRALNPGVEHVNGDMRSVRLGRTFDAVFIHDAITYMLTEDDLRAAFETAYTHLRAGGCAVIFPDDTTETYVPRTSAGGHDGEGRSMRYLEWMREAAPGGTTHETSYVFALLEEGKPLRVEHEDHVVGLFPHATWVRLLEGVGFTAHSEPEWPPAFVGVRPA